MKAYQYPTVKELAARLAEAKYCAVWEHFPSFDVRLQVLPSGWRVWTGDAQYDTDHRGVWGAGEVDRTTNCRALARALLDEAREMAADSPADLW
jgi:hypothetical protein